MDKPEPHPRHQGVAEFGLARALDALDAGSNPATLTTAPLVELVDTLVLETSA